MKELFDYIDIASALSASDGIVIGWVKGNRRYDDPAFDELLASQLNQLGVYAKDKNQRILIEVINRYETNLFNTSKELVSFIRKWDLPNCFVHLDTFHMNIEEANMADAIRTAGSLLGYFHVADSDRGVPGRAHLNFKEMFSALDEIGYKGTISLECIPGKDCISTAKEGYDYLSNNVHPPRI